LKLASWNVNGLRAVLKKDALGPFLDAEAPDLVFLQEIKSTEADVKLDLPGWTVVWNSAEKKGYSGTALLSRRPPVSVRRGFSAEVRAAFPMEGDPFGDPNTEGRVLTAEYESFYAVTVYTPNAKDDLGRLPLRQKLWDPAFLAHCRELEAHKPVAFCGDLNVAHTELDLANPKPNRGKKGFTVEERAGFQAFLDAGYSDTFRLFTPGNGHYTWWAVFGGARERNVGWRIDYWLVSAGLKDRVRAAEIHPGYLGSDHCPVSLTLDL